jgi:hypothetical protein
MPWHKASLLPTTVPLRLSNKLGYCNWKFHLEVFYRILCEKWKRVAMIPLAVERSFEDLKDISTGYSRTRDILCALFRICKTYRPFEIDLAALAVIREYLEDMSQHLKVSPAWVLGCKLQSSRHCFTFFSQGRVP